MNRSILVVDDDPAIRETLTWRLEADGWNVLGAADGRTAIELAAAEAVTLIILDLSLPDMSGLDVLCEVRRTRPLPVIILTGRNGEADRVIGLDRGADDYVVKPFSPLEISSRVRSVLRRTLGEQHELCAGELSIDLVAHEVSVSGRAVDLTPREYELLVFLARSPRQAFSREQLLRQVWLSEPGWQDLATVTQHIHRLRSKLEPDPEHPHWLRTVSRVGYRFQP